MENNLTKNLPTSLAETQTPEDVKTVLDDFMRWLPKYSEHAQGRTNFQIEKFIALEDGTPANNYINVLYQTRVIRGEILREVKEAVELQRNNEYRWKNRDLSEPIHTVDKDGNDRYAWYDLEQMVFQHRFEELKLGIKDKLSQLETMNAILETIEKNNGGEIDREQVEEEAPLYWERRFERQMVDSVIGNSLGVSSGDVKSVRLAAAPSIIPGSNNQIAEDSFANQIINGKIGLDAIKILGNERTSGLYDAISKPGFISERYENANSLPFDGSEEPKAITETPVKPTERKSIHTPDTKPNIVTNKYGIDKDKLKKLGVKVD